MSDELSGRDLDRAIAEAMGWRVWLTQHGQYTHAVWQTGADEPWKRTQRAYWNPEAYTEITWREIDPMKHIESESVPRFHASLDALRDGPEKVLREAGWRRAFFNRNENMMWGWWKGRQEVLYSEDVYGETAARALAALRALRAPAEEAGRE